MTYDLAFDPHELRDLRGRWRKSAVLAGMHKVIDSLEREVRVDGGPDRKLMPQLSGVPKPGSKADRMFPNRPAGNEVDLTSQFQDWLIAKGVQVKDIKVPTTLLKPSQDQLVAGKVLGLAKYMDTAPANSPVFEPIFTTGDGYVIDGHHRWAASVVLSSVSGKAQSIKVRQIQAGRKLSLRLATQFMDEYGLPRVGMTNTTTVSKMVNLSVLHDVSHELRKPNGEWTKSSSVIDISAAVSARREARKISPNPPKGPKGTITKLRQRKTKAGHPLIPDTNADDHARKAAAERARIEELLAPTGIEAPPVFKIPSYAAVAQNYEWADRDKQGSDLTPDAVQSIHQQGKAQIKAFWWYSNIPDSATELEKYAAGTWNQYQNPGLYGHINGTLRAKRGEPGGPTYEMLKPIITEMFNKGGIKTTAPMTVYRALRSDNGLNWPEKLQPGSTFQDDGVISTTAHNRFSQGWLALSPTGEEEDDAKLSDVVMEIRVPKGQTILGGNPQFIETMLPPGTKFKVISSKQVRAPNPATPLANDTEVAGLPPFTYTHVVVEVTS